MPKFEDPEFGLVFLNNFLVGGDESNQIFPERVSTSLKKACGNISRGTSLDKICQVFFGKLNYVLPLTIMNHTVLSIYPTLKHCFKLAVVLRIQVTPPVRPIAQKC